MHLILSQPIEFIDSNEHAGPIVGRLVHF